MLETESLEELKKISCYLEILISKDGRHQKILTAKYPAKSAELFPTELKK